MWSEMIGAGGSLFNGVAVYIEPWGLGAYIGILFLFLWFYVGTHDNNERTPTRTPASTPQTMPPDAT